MENDVRRALPSKRDAERAVVGAAFRFRNWAAALAQFGFRSEWLHFPNHRTIWHIVADAWEVTPEEQEVSPVDVQTRLMRENLLEEVGGPGEVMEIFNNPIPSDSLEVAEYWAGVLRDEWMKREAINIGTILVQQAYRKGDGINEELAEAVRRLGSLSMPCAGSKLVNAREVLRQFIDELSESIESGRPMEHGLADAVQTDFADVNEKIGGLIPYFWLIGAETSGGKTVLAMQLVRSVLRASRRALVFPLEMRAMQLVRRVVAAEGEVPMSRLKSPWKLLYEDMPKITGPGSAWNPDRLTIYDDQDVTIQEVRRIARAEHAKEPLGCVLLDYCQLASAGRFREGANREQEISFIGAELAKMSSELGCPVIAPTQLNDEGKVRESRALKHHAAVYLVIDEGDDSKKPPQPPRILCVKNRDGEREWTMPYKLTGDIQTFERR